MKILALESSALAASAALLTDGELTAEVWQRTGLTHSQTLLPMTENMLKASGTKLCEIDLFAVANGPGSYTGLRIGVAAVKGLAAALDRPCIGISTLEGLFFAHPVYPAGSAVACVMDARAGQVYAAAFDACGTRLLPDRALALQELLPDLLALGRPLWLAGDGAHLAYDALQGKAPVTLAPGAVRWQHARGVALAAAARPETDYVSASALRTEYLRLSQAEREKLAREQGVK